MNDRIKQLLNLISQAIFDKKGINIIALDVTKLSSMTDYVLIAEGNVDRHVKAIGEEITRTLRAIGERPLQIEGRQNGDWVVIDYSEIVIHLFMPGMREKYQLEKLWEEGEIIDLDIDVSSAQPSQAIVGE